MKSPVSSDFYQKLGELFSGIEKLLNKYGKSKILQNHYMDMFKSFFYATLINNFFTNLSKANVKDLGLPRGKIGQIKSKYKDLRKSIRQSLALFPKCKTLTAKDYSNFKSMIKKDFPEFQKIVHEIEKIINFKKAKEYLKEKCERVRKSGKLDPDFNDVFMTKLLETYILKGKSLPIGKKMAKLTKIVVKKSIPELSQRIRKTLDENSKRMLDYQRTMMKGFENRLYKKWKVPIDLLECLIKVTLESAVAQRIKLSKMPDAKNNSKYEALIQIHARALQISNEILVLLKSGYPDGAYSRWRSLHELAVITFFLYENSEEVSKRYLDHEIVTKFNEAMDYKANYKKLGYAPLSRKEFNKVKREKERLCRQYGNDFIKKDYGWIPSSLLSNRNFRALEENVKLKRLRPFYNLSCDSVHGGSKGLYRLGLKHEAQESILLVGSSDYGLADPIQNTAISLSRITTCLLGLKHDFETTVQMQVIRSYVEDIKTEAANVQERMDKRT